MFGQFTTQFQSWLMNNDPCENTFMHSGGYQQTASNVYCPTCGKMLQSAEQGARVMAHSKKMAANHVPFKPKP